ncbi:delta-type opioid receptor-like [Tubulanus polymorphus]|uniref:delta-type opioid receptor-like n=1 Tax=Tubulanus polymorphus TaxID=672921 RepID=UPI003DA6B9F7
MLAFIGSFSRAKKSPAHFFMASLAVADLFALTTKSTIFLLNLNKHQADIAQCKLSGFVEHLSAALSAWYLVLMTMDRTIAVTQPLKAHRLCTVRRAKKQIALSTTILIFLDSIAFWVYGVELTRDGHTNCNMVNASMTFLYIFEILFRSFESYVPFVIITILNTIMALTVRRSRRIQAKMTQHQSTNSAGNRVTIMVVIVSVAFLLFTGPYNLSFLLTLKYSTWNDAMDSYTNSCESSQHALLILYFLSHTILDLNFIINGFIYSLSSSQFRRDLAKVICPAAVRKRLLRGSSSLKYQGDTVPTVSMSLSSSKSSIRKSGSENESVDTAVTL